MKQLVYILFPILIIGCGQSAQKIATEDQNFTEIELPFLNEPTFTPEWIDKESPDYANIHTIPPFNLQNQNGEWIKQSDLDGKVYVANFFFSICPNVCPMMTGNLLILQEAFQSNPNVKIVSHTVMPWIDSVATLKEYEEFNGIDGSHWYLLTGEKREIYKLGRDAYYADEGFGKTVTDEDDFLHTENFILIDQKRRIRGVYNGTLQIEAKRLIEDINSLLEMASINPYKTSL